MCKFDYIHNQLHTGKNAQTKEDYVWHTDTKGNYWCEIGIIELKTTVKRVSKHYSTSINKSSKPSRK